MKPGRAERDRRAPGPRVSIEMCETVKVEPTICFSEVTYRIDGSSAAAILSDISFNIFAGETVILLGRSGSGKTTLLRLINGLVAPTAGNIVISSRAIADWDRIELRRSIGYVIQEGGLFPHFTVAENVGLVPELIGWDPARVSSRVDQMLELVGLGPQQYRQRLPRELSGGQRQRVGVARALAADPPILLMDEPFGALDPVTRAELQREFRDLAARLRKTIVFVTHDVREALLLGSRIVLLDSGNIVADHKPDDFQKVQHPEVHAFLASLDLSS
jgi:osmoprotectant transport system ATP-binding protein